MSTIELFGRVDEKGKLEFEPPANLTPGAVRIIIEAVDSEAEAADALLRMAKKAHEDHLAGLTKDLDLDDPELFGD